ncbi:hypothetical protein [Streptomyces sp. NPDC002746]
MTLGALAAVAMTVVVPGSAYAAEGALFINDQTFEDPSGCYPVASTRLSVSNHTDAIAEVHSGPNCTGPVTNVVYPGITLQAESGGRSVFIL